MPPESVEVLIETGERPLNLVLQRPQYHHCNYNFGDGPLGLVLATDQSGAGTIVSRVLPHSPATHFGVREGSFMVSVNGEDVSRCDHPMVQAMIASAPRPIKLRMRFVVGAEVASGAASAAHPTTDHTAAPTDGPLDSQILTSGSSHPPPLPSSELPALAPTSQPSSAPRPFDGQVVTATFSAGQLGLHLIGNSTGDTVIHSVDPGSLAAEQPISEGALLIEANGESLRGLDHQTVAVILASATRPLTLRVGLYN